MQKQARGKGAACWLYPSWSYHHHNGGNDDYYDVDDDDGDKGDDCDEEEELDKGVKYTNINS